MKRINTLSAFYKERRRPGMAHGGLTARPACAVFAFLLLCLPTYAQDDLFAGDTARWNAQREDTTDHFAIYWEAGFGKDITDPPSLDGHDMHVDLPHLKRRLEYFHTIFSDSLSFMAPIPHDRMRVYIWYSLEGTAYGGDEDGKIGAFWAAPGRLQDERMNTVAHELGHSFQSQLAIDGWSEGFKGCGGFYEMTSQWMLWQCNPRWIDDETYHWDAFRRLTWRAFLHGDNIYHSPYVLEYWSGKRGKGIIADLWKNVRGEEDPVEVYTRLTGISQSQLLDEMHDCHRRIVNLDFPRVFSLTRRHAGGGAWQPSSRAVSSPSVITDTVENLGFRVYPLRFRGSRKVTAALDAECGRQTYPSAYRVGFVAVMGDSTSRYSDVGSIDCSSSPSRLQLRYKAPKGAERLYLVVTGGFADRHRTLSEAPDAIFPFTLTIKGGDFLR